MLHHNVNDFLPPTHVSSTPYALEEFYSGRVYDNTGATAEINFQLPSVSFDVIQDGGPCYTFYVQDSDGLRVTAPSGLGKAINLVNELKEDYNRHRILVSGSVHGAADTTNIVTSANATDQASAITLANEIKADYNAHRVLTAGGVHGAADATNVVSSANATDLASLITLVNEIKVDYNAHRILTAGGVHGAADTTNSVIAINAASETIRVLGSVSAAGGYASAATIGNFLTVKKISATEWVAIGVGGTWSVT